MIGGGLTAIDTATELMAYYPLQVEKTLRQYEALAAELGETRVRSSTMPKSSSCSTSIWRTGAPCARSGSAPAHAGEPPDFVPLVREWGGVTHRLSQAHGRLAGLPSEPRRSDQGARGRNRVRGEPQPDRGGARRVRRRQGDDLQARRAGGRQDGPDGPITLPARTVLVAAGTTPNITYEKESAGTFQLDAKKKFFQPHAVGANSDGSLPARRRIPTGSSPRTKRAASSSPTTATTIRAMPATSSRRWRRRKMATRTCAGLFAEEIAPLDPATQAERDARGGARAAARR